MTAYRLRLPFSEVLVDEANRIVETRFRDGRSGIGMREDSQVNRDEAADQGYAGDDMVWQSLLHHEILHSLISLWLWDKPSPTLRHEARAARVPYGIRLGEEAIVLAMQHYLMTGQVWPILDTYRERLPRWANRFADALLRMEEVPAGSDRVA